ncbi:MAG: fibronectin type III domain-containing protein [Desulfuromusa sp.]
MKSYQILIVSFLILVNLISSAFCQDITLSWDPSPTPDIDGYKVYYKQDNMNLPFDGTGATEGSSPVDVGHVLSKTLTGLTDGATYFFSVTAYQNPDTESSYSNIVSNSWLPGLLLPTDNATNEPVPVTFRWDTAPAGYDVAYTLYYGTNQNEVGSATSTITPPLSSGDKNIPTGMVALAAVLLLGIMYRSFPQIKFLPQAVSLLLFMLLGGMLTACGGGGGGGDSATDHSATSTGTPTVESVLYSVDKGSSDYHQAYDLLASTTYYWKVVATDTQDPNLTYESEIRQFTTEAF